MSHQQAPRDWPAPQIFYLPELQGDLGHLSCLFSDKGSLGALLVEQNKVLYLCTQLFTSHCRATQAPG